MTQGKRPTLLIVDDDEGLRSAIVYDFQRRGFEVLEASSGNQAFEVTNSRHVDLILTDVRMPDGTGVELLDRVKARDPEVPVVILITGFADLSVEDAYAKGADAVFSKPFDRKVLIAAVVRALMSRDEQWNPRSEERLPSNLEIRLTFPGVKEAAHGKILNFGRGGMFVAMDEPPPSVNDLISFEIAFEQGALKTLDGQGLVRWRRIQATEGFKPGCGIEFTRLSDTCRRQVSELIALLRTKSFIPKG